MAETPHDLACRLAEQAEAVCRYYLSAGRRQGNYWKVGDARNTPGQSLFVRLRSSVKGPAGKWVDGASQQHGDLLDIIREGCGLTNLAATMEEARRFLGLPHPDRVPAQASPGRIAPAEPAPSNPGDAARRLFAMAQPLPGTLAEMYLRKRGIAALHETANLRFHPRCYYRPDDRNPTETWPALVAAVTDLDGYITGAHRTWLAHDGSGKAPIATPRRAMGDLLRHAVRFGMAQDVLAGGEGIETVLSLRCVLPIMPMAAALSAAHLAALLFPPTLRRLYVVHDNDPAGDSARDRLIERAASAGIEAIPLSPVLGDVNDDLRLLGVEALQAHLRVQLAPQDVARFMELRNP